MWRQPGRSRLPPEDILYMQWDRTKTIGLAKVSCSFCHGYGLRLVPRGKEAPCQCIFRADFRACLNRFRECAAKGAHTSTVTLEFCGGADGRRTYSRKREEYIADFCLISRRHLTEAEHRIFRFHFLLGADWKLCCHRLGMDRGTFFHHVYRIQQTLGKAFAETQPYALFPLDEYFNGVPRRRVSWVPRSVPIRSQLPHSETLLPLTA